MARKSGGAAAPERAFVPHQLPNSLSIASSKSHSPHGYSGAALKQRRISRHSCDMRMPAGRCFMHVRTLGLLRMSGTFYCRSELTARWGVTIPSKPGHMWFHVVTEGEAWLEVLTLGARK